MTENSFASASDLDPHRIEAAVQSLATKEGRPVDLATALGRWTTFRIGGPALGLCRIQNPVQAQRFQELAHCNGLPLFFLGGGSNILADDRGYCGLVLKMEIQTFATRAERVTVGAGMDFDELIRRTLQAGLVGLEFASGIPGTVGGAIVGNAGCYGHQICEFVEEVTLLKKQGGLVRAGPQDMEFGYRQSNLQQSGDLLLEVTLKLRRADTEAAWQTRQEKLADRRNKHPVDLPCAGSYFRNLPPGTGGTRRQPAGRLLEEAGAKSMSVGGAAVFSKHANIIVNTGSATCRDVLALAAQMKGAVREKFGIQLVEEVKHLAWLGSEEAGKPAGGGQAGDVGR